jgi:hypothetical protein
VRILVTEVWDQQSYFPQIFLTVYSRKKLLRRHVHVRNIGCLRTVFRSWHYATQHVKQLLHGLHAAGRIEYGYALCAVFTRDFHTWKNAYWGGLTFLRVLEIPDHAGIVVIGDGHYRKTALTACV